MFNCFPKLVSLLLGPIAQLTSILSTENITPLLCLLKAQLNRRLFHGKEEINYKKKNRHISLKGESRTLLPEPK